MMPTKRPPNHITQKTVSTDLQSLSAAAFAKELTALQLKHGVSGSLKIARDHFESFEDIEDFLIHAPQAEIVSGSAINASRRRATTNSRSSQARAAIARELARKAEAKKSRNAPRRASPKTRTARAPKPSFSTLVEPGIYLGPPWRLLHWKAMPREVKASSATFRRQRYGIGKCTGNKLKDVKRAFSNAYYLAETARQEVAAIRQSPDARILWHASLEYPEASLAYWFGADYSPQQMGRMLLKIETILSEWSLAFCSGFRDLLPVFIRCKSVNGVGGGPARHLVANTIELFPRYFNMSRERQIVTMLHEMGHRSTHITKPRDERHDLCSGGWNAAENMCYREPRQPDNDDGLFHEGNPRNLARAAEQGNLSARKTALNNIDNYVSYMWNREKDRGGNMMQVLAPGAKPPRPPRKATKPSSH